MVTCSNSDSCPNGRWFHLLCAEFDDEDDVPEGDWWCSDICKIYSIFCICKRRLIHLPIITCANRECSGGRKFHLRGIGLHNTVIQGKNRRYISHLMQC